MNECPLQKTKMIAVIYIWNLFFLTGTVSFQKGVENEREYRSKYSTKIILPKAPMLSYAPSFLVNYDTKTAQKFKEIAYRKVPQKFQNSCGGGVGPSLENTQIKASFFLASLRDWIGPVGQLSEKDFGLAKGN